MTTNQTNKLSRRTLEEVYSIIKALATRKPSSFIYADALRRAPLIYNRFLRELDGELGARRAGERNRALEKAVKSADDKLGGLTQQQLILNHLNSGKQITQLEALVEYNSLRLSAIIHRLRCVGYNIKTNYIKTKSGKTIASYQLLKDKAVE